MKKQNKCGRLDKNIQEKHIISAYKQKEDIPDYNSEISPQYLYNTTPTKALSS